MSVVGGVSLAVGEASVSDAQVAIADLAAVSQATGVPFDGVLGYNFLRSFRVTIDFRASRLLLE